MFTIDYNYDKWSSMDEKMILLRKYIPKTIHCKFIKEVVYYEENGVLDETKCYMDRYNSHYLCKRTFDEEYKFIDYYTKCDMLSTGTITYITNLIDGYGLYRKKDNQDYIRLEFLFNYDEDVPFFIEVNNSNKNLKCVLINFELYVKYMEYIVKHKIYIRKIHNVKIFFNEDIILNTDNDSHQQFYLIFLSDDDELMMKLKYN